jgi:hypothetical protein
MGGDERNLAALLRESVPEPGAGISFDDLAVAVRRRRRATVLFPVASAVAVIAVVGAAPGLGHDDSSSGPQNGGRSRRRRHRLRRRPIAAGCPKTEKLPAGQAVMVELVDFLEFGGRQYLAPMSGEQTTLRSDLGNQVGEVNCTVSKLTEEGDRQVVGGSGTATRDTSRWGHPSSLCPATPTSAGSRSSRTTRFAPTWPGTRWRDTRPRCRAHSRHLPATEPFLRPGHLLHPHSAPSEQRGDQYCSGRQARPPGVLVPEPRLAARRKLRDRPQNGPLVPDQGRHPSCYRWGPERALTSQGRAVPGGEERLEPMNTPATSHRLSRMQPFSAWWCWGVRSSACSPCTAWAPTERCGTSRCQA